MYKLIILWQHDSVLWDTVESLHQDGNKDKRDDERKIKEKLKVEERKGNLKKKKKKQIEEIEKKEKEEGKEEKRERWK